MAEESRRASGEPVGSRLEHHDQVPDVGLCHFHAVGEQIDWRAQRADRFSISSLQEIFFTK